MPIKIPEGQYDALASLLRLDNDNWNYLVEILKNEPPTLSLSRYVSNATSKLTRIERAERIIFILISFFSLREKIPGSLSQLLNALGSAAEQTGKPELSPEKQADNWSRLKDRLTKLFDGQSSLEIIAKAQDIQYEEEHLFTETRIISDLRPIFRKDIEAQPDALLVTHTLKIIYEDLTGSKEIYVALDKEDLEKLQDTVARALRKESTLRELSKKLGIPCLDETGAD